MAAKKKGWLLAGAGVAALVFTAHPAEAGFESRLDSPSQGCNTGSLKGCSIERKDKDGETFGETPALIKFEHIKFDNDGNVTEFKFETNGSAGYDLTDFEYRFIIKADPNSIKNGEASSGTWSYNGLVGDPFIGAFSTKTGSGGNGNGNGKGNGNGANPTANSALIYSWIGPEEGSKVGVAYEWKTATGQAVSSIVFANTGVVPLPAAAWMFLGGLGVVGGALKWRRRAATGTD